MLVRVVPMDARIREHDDSGIDSVTLANAGVHLHPSSFSMFSGGRPMTALSARTTSGLAMRIGFADYASIHCASLNVLPANFSL